MHSTKPVSVANNCTPCTKHVGSRFRTILRRCTRRPFVGNILHTRFVHGVGVGSCCQAKRCKPYETRTMRDSGRKQCKAPLGYEPPRCLWVSPFMYVSTDIEKAHFPTKRPCTAGFTGGRLPLVGKLARSGKDPLHRCEMTYHSHHTRRKNPRHLFVSFSSNEEGMQCE